MVLSGSEHGDFQLLAEGSIDLTFGSSPSSILKPSISAGPALLDKAFDPLRPDAWYGSHSEDPSFDGAFSSVVLSHQNDSAIARIIAAKGNIVGSGSANVATIDGVVTVTGLTRVEINRPTQVYAGGNITDLNLIVQNIRPSDVSSVIAGGNISYTGLNVAGGLQVAGPGFFVVQAGGDLGPFLPVAQDTATTVKLQQGIASVGNASFTPVGNSFLAPSPSGGLTGIYNNALLGPFSINAAKRRNALLSSSGADIIALFGVAKGIDYKAMISAYVDPANAAGSPHNYAFNTGALRGFLTGDEILNFLESPAGLSALEKAHIDLTKNGDPHSIDLDKLNKYIADPNQAWSLFADLLPQQIQRDFIDVGSFLLRFGPRPADQTSAWATFQLLRPDLQQVFVDQVFFAELKAVGQSSDRKAATPRGYQVTETMFPSSYGYTASDGSSLVKTGDLNLLHGTIQTRLGGDISIFGPGGNILVGPLAPEPNPNLKLSDLGILTLGGGAINALTDGSVQVNSSRVLTTQGGDIVIWSSNGDIDFGRGSKTTLSLPPLQVLFDNNDYQSIDLGGFVTGAGIATLQASGLARRATVYVLAPRGTIDFGVAGGRSSGDLVVVAPVVANASNIQVQGTATGIPVISVPSAAGLTTAGNSAAAATRSSETPTAGGNRDRASVFIVEVVGYGGGDGAASNPAPANETATGAGPAPTQPAATPSAQDSGDRKKKTDDQQ
jgi:hypothetical protein